MAKGYWVGHVTVHDPEAYKQYQALNAAAFKKYNARFLVRGGPAETVSGALKARHVVIEFESVATAKACHDSPEYKAARAVRDRAADVDMAIVEGYDG